MSVPNRNVSRSITMKKIALIVMMVALACGGMFAQSATQPAAPALTTVQASGTLAWINGRIAIKDGGKTYYVEGIQRVLGFVDGLKEGSSVKVDGYPIADTAAPEYIFLHLTKITFNGKEYAIAQQSGKGMGFGMHGRDGMMNGTRGGFGRK
jgi:hypothetical protein